MSGVGEDKFFGVLFKQETVKVLRVGLHEWYVKNGRHYIPWKLKFIPFLDLFFGKFLRKYITNAVNSE